MRDVRGDRPTRQHPGDQRRRARCDGAQRVVPLQPAFHSGARHLRGLARSPSATTRAGDATDNPLGRLQRRVGVRPASVAA